MMNGWIYTGLAAAALLWASGCADAQTLERLESNQERIIGKLDTLLKVRPRGAVGPAAQRPKRPDPKQVYAMPVGDSHSKGPADAWITIVEVSDFQCPFCKRAGPLLDSIEKRYGDDVRVVFKHNPLSFHPRAKPAAIAAECAGEQGKFWPMHDVLFENAKALEDGQLSTYAQRTGVDMQRWKQCYDGARPKARIERDQKLALSFGARGTPAFFINGRVISGTKPLPEFTQVIDEELKKAKASGIRKADYYATAVVGRGKKKL